MSNIETDNHIISAENNEFLHFLDRELQKTDESLFEILTSRSGIAYDEFMDELYGGMTDYDLLDL